MVLEDPEAALEAVLPHVHSVHFKDHVMVRPEHAGQLKVVGVAVGDGFLPLTRLSQRLLEHGLRRMTFENVWAYSAPIRESRAPLAGVTLGEGAFAYADPPFDAEYLVLDQSQLSPEQLVDLEYKALIRGTSAFRSVLTELGCSLPV